MYHKSVRYLENTTSCWDGRAEGKGTSSVTNRCVKRKHVRHPHIFTIRYIKVFKTQWCDLETSSSGTFLCTCRAVRCRETHVEFDSADSQSRKLHRSRFPCGDILFEVILYSVAKSSSSSCPCRILNVFSWSSGNGTEGCTLSRGEI